MKKGSVKSLPSLINRLSGVSLIFVAVLTVFGLFVFSDLRNYSINSESKLQLTANLNSQLDRLIPTFLLPEQRDGLPLLLERFKATEELKEIGVAESISSLPETLRGCSISQEESTVCQTDSTDEIAVVAPIKEGSRFFGYYFKIRSVNGPLAGKHIIFLSGLILAIFLVTFLVIQRVQARLLSKMVPESIQRLTDWIDSDLNDRPQETPDLYVKELETLRVKISESLDRYKQSRDQAVIGQLTSGIMHDLKTPLQSLVSAVNLVESSKNEEHKRQMLEVLFETTRDTLGPIQDIIETTLDGNREIALRRVDSSAEQTVNFVINQNREIAKRNRVDVNMDIESNLMLSHDPVQFARALSNILKNGIEAASEGPIDRRVKLSGYRVNNEVIFSVSDTGPGLRVEPSRMFRVFRSSKIRGAGLGLLITKRIVEAHGGKIEAHRQSALGGAEFRITIPGGLA